MKRNPPCPFCKGHATREGSLKELKAQAFKYHCTQCKKYFSTFTETVFWYVEFPVQVVATALELILQLGLSYAQTQHALKSFWNVEVSKSVFTSWVKNFRGLELPKPQFTNVWHVDEMFVKHEERLPNGKRRYFDYLWVVLDSKQQLIALYLSNKRDLNAAKAALQKARETAGFVPRVVVSDEYSVYPKAIRAVLRGALHVKAHFETKVFFWQNEAWLLSNNKAESLNSRLRDRLRRRRGLKSLKLGSRFLDCLEAVWNCRFMQSLARALLQTIPA